MFQLDDKFLTILRRDQVDREILALLTMAARMLGATKTRLHQQAIAA